MDEVGEWTAEPFEEDRDSNGVREIFCGLLSLAVRGKLQDRRIEACWHLLRGVTSPKEIGQVMCVQARTADGYLRDARDFFGLVTNEELVRRLWRLYTFAWGKPSVGLMVKFGEQYDDLSAFPEVPGKFSPHGLELTVGELRQIEATTAREALT